MRKIGPYNATKDMFSLSKSTVKRCLECLNKEEIEKSNIQLLGAKIFK